MAGIHGQGRRSQGRQGQGRAGQGPAGALRQRVPHHVHLLRNPVVRRLLRASQLRCAGKTCLPLLGTHWGQERVQQVHSPDKRTFH